MKIQINTFVYMEEHYAQVWQFLASYKVTAPEDLVPRAQGQAEG